MTRNWLVALIAVAVGLTLMAPSRPWSTQVQANSFTVSTTDDGGPGSLRAAIAAANTNPGPDTITFDIDGMFSVLSTLNIQDEGTTIDGSGHAIVLDGSALPSPANVVQVAATSVQMVGFTIRNAPSNGVSVHPAVAGGCAGTVTAVFLDNMVLESNGESGLLVCAGAGAGVGVNNSEILSNGSGITVSGALAGGTRVNNSRIASNGVGINLQGSASGTLNAQGNWWGCGTGANTLGCDSTSAGIDTSSFQTLDAFRVTNLNDSGSGSLRRAINDANTRPGLDIIRFSVSGRIVLTGGAFPVTDDLVVDASDRVIIIDAAAMPAPNNVFQVSGQSFTLTGLTIAGAPSNAVALGAGCAPGFSATISRLTLESSGEAGISVCSAGGATVSVSDVRFNGGSVGLRVTGASASGVTVTSSQFNNQAWAAVENATTGWVGAQGNWWGCAGGANSPGCGLTLGLVDVANPVSSYYVVDTLNATGPGSLHDAVTHANTDPDPNIINFAVDGIINLTGLQLVLTDSETTIDGSGRDVTLRWTSAGHIRVEADHAVLRALTIEGAQIAIDRGACDGHIEGFTLEAVKSTAGPGQQNLNLCARSASDIAILDSNLSGSSIKAVQLCGCSGPTTAFDLTGLTVANTVIASGRTALDVGVGGGDPVHVEGLQILSSELVALGSTGPRAGFAASGAPLSAVDVLIENSLLSGAVGVAVDTAGSLAASGFAIRGNTINGGVAITSLTASGTVSGITVEGNTITGGDPLGAVFIRANAISGIDVADNPAITKSTPGGAAIFLQAASAIPSSITNISISGNGTLSGPHGVLIGSDAAAHTTISEVNVSQNGSITGASLSGVSVFGLGGATISDVAIDQNGPIFGGGTRGISIGSISAAAEITRVSVSNNQSIAGMDAGVRIGNADATASNSALLINGNGTVKAMSPGAPAIQLLSGNPGLGNTISDNVITDSAVGVLLTNAVPGASTGLTIVGNVIANNSLGVLVESGAAGDVVLRLNNVTGNLIGLRNDDPVNGFDAEQNWWGCAGGPGSAGCDSSIEALPGSVDTTPWLDAAIALARTSVAVSGGESASISGAPTAGGLAGAVASVQTVGSTPTTVTVSTYDGNPATTVFDVGGSFVDIFVSEPTAVDQVTATLYYPSTLSGQAEAALSLYYFDGDQWLEVRGSGGATPAKDTTDNLDGTVSGGRFAIVFDDTSIPTAADLNGTILTFTPDSDGDGHPEATDQCPASILTATVVIDGTDTGVPNTLLANGCSISDLTAQAAASASNHGKFVSAVAKLTNDLKKAGIISGAQKGAIQNAAAQADIP